MVHAVSASARPHGAGVIVHDAMARAGRQACQLFSVQVQ